MRVSDGKKVLLKQNEPPKTKIDLSFGVLIMKKSFLTQFLSLNIVEIDKKLFFFQIFRDKSQLGWNKLWS